MNKKKIAVIIVFLSLIVLVFTGFVIFKIVKNAQKEKEHEQWLKEQQREYEERNNTLYEKYNGRWCSKEDGRIYFTLYKDEEGIMCLSFSSIVDGKVTESSYRNVSLNVGESSWGRDGTLYFQVFYDAGYCDAGGWFDFLIYEEDDNKLGYDDIVYYRS